jgi:hypothetical protein
MNLLQLKGTFTRQGARLTKGFIVLGCLLPAVLAQTLEEHATSAAKPPYALLQNSTLVGSGNTLTATQIPVVLSTGTVYVTLEIQFSVDSKGDLTISSGYPQTVAAPRPQVSSFAAGSYVGPSTIDYGNALITVSGPGVTQGGPTMWSLSASSGANVCTYPGSATWYAGPISSNPLASRLKSAGITSTVWSYGIGNACGNLPNWANNVLIGVSQIGNSLTIVTFTSNGQDQSEPVDQITYTLQP